MGRTLRCGLTTLFILHVSTYTLISLPCKPREQDNLFSFFGDTISGYDYFGDQASLSLAPFLWNHAQQTWEILTSHNSEVQEVWDFWEKGGWELIAWDWEQALVIGSFVSAFQKRLYQAETSYLLIYLFIYCECHIFDHKRIKFEAF